MKCDKKRIKKVHELSNLCGPEYFDGAPSSHLPLLGTGAAASSSGVVVASSGASASSSGAAVASSGAAASSSGAAVAASGAAAAKSSSCSLVIRDRIFTPLN